MVNYFKSHTQIYNIEIKIVKVYKDVFIKQQIVI